MITLYELTCQECGYTEIVKKQNTKGEMKCKKCKNDSYDLGAARLYDDTKQRFIEDTEDE